MRNAVILFVLFIWSDVGHGQFQDITSKRRKVKVPNYTLFLHLHDMALEYSTKLDFKIDSLFEAHQVSHHKNLFDFRIRALQSMQHVLYKSDPVVGFVDGWVYGVQLVNYLGTAEAQEHLTFGHGTITATFKDFLKEFPESYISFTGADPGVLWGRVTQFAKDHPIHDYHLNRTSITDATAQWVGEATIGFKSGVATLTDALRNLSDRLNYHAEFTPKMIEWNVEQSIGNVIGVDSIGAMLEHSVSSLDRIGKILDSIDYHYNHIMSSVLSDVERQRGETLGFMSEQRRTIIEQVTKEREAVMAQVTEERQALEQLVREERQASFEEAQKIIQYTTDQSFDRLENLVNTIFLKLLVLTAIISLGIMGQ